MGFLESLFGLKRGRRGRPPKMPERETRPFPTLMQLGMRNNKWRYLYKPTPRNLRYFSHAPFARRDADVNRNQGEVNEDRDWNQAIKPCASQISSHLTRDVLHLKLGFSQLRFKFVGLDREDELANATIYKLRYEGNAITPNEYRARLGEAPAEHEWGDMTFADVQIALNAARGAGEVDDPKLPKGKTSKKDK